MTNQRDKLALFDFQVDVIQRDEGAFRCIKGHFHAGQLQMRFSHGYLRYSFQAIFFWITNMIRSSTKPIKPIANTAAMIRLRDWLLPFWNSSQTNLPSPGLCASISAAISTIQAIPSETRSPVKIMGMDDGRTTFLTWVQNDSCRTRETFSKSGFTAATPTPVLIRVGQRLQRVTVIIEVRNDFSNIGSSLT